MMTLVGREMNIMIDTEIWSYAFKKPQKEKFPTDDLFLKAMEMHKKAKELISNSLVNPQIKIYVSTHQLAEIFHVLGFRGHQLPLNFVTSLLADIIISEKIVKVPVRIEHVVSAIDLSFKTKIHIWDFLCFLPIKDFISKIFTNDEHFKHNIFSDNGRIEVINPFKDWIKI